MSAQATVTSRVPKFDYNSIRFIPEDLEALRVVIRFNLSQCRRHHLNIATAQEKLSVPAAGKCHQIIASSDPNMGINLNRREECCAANMTSMRNEIISPAKQLHSNGGGKPVSSPKETKKDVASATDSVEQQHKEGNKMIGGSLYITKANMEQFRQDDVVRSRTLSPNTTTTTTTAEKAKRKSSLSTLQKQKRVNGGHVLSFTPQLHFPRSEMTTALSRNVPLSTEEAFHDLCCMKLASRKRSSTSAKILSSGAFQECASSSMSNGNNNNSSGNDEGSSSYDKRKSSGSTRHTPPLSDKGILSIVALRTSMKLKTISNKRRILTNMIRVAEQRHYQSELISALAKKNNAVASGVLAKLRMGAALLDVCLTLKRNCETIECEKRTCVALEKKAKQIGIVLPSSSEETSSTTIPVKPRVERGVEEVLYQLYSRLLAAEVMSQSMEGCQLEEPVYSPLFKTLQSLKKNADDKNVVFGGFEAEAEAEAEPEFRRRRVLPLNNSGGAEEAAASEGGVDDDESLDDVNLTEDYFQREEDNGSLMVPHVWKYYPLACPIYNSPLFLSPLSCRPDFVVLALSDIKNDEGQGCCDDEQPTVRVRGDDAENDIEMSSNYSTAAMQYDDEKGEEKRVNAMLGRLSLSRERRQWAQAFACQLSSTIRSIASGRRTLMDVRTCVFTSLTGADNEIEKLETELVELQKRKLERGYNMPKPVDDDGENPTSTVLQEEDEEEGCVAISPFSSSDTVVEIFERCTNVNEERRQQQQSVLSKCNEEPSREEEDDDALQVPASRKRRAGKRLKVSTKAKLHRLEKELGISTRVMKESEGKTTRSSRQRLRRKR